MSSNRTGSPPLPAVGSHPLHTEVCGDPLAA